MNRLLIHPTTSTDHQPGSMEGRSREREQRTVPNRGGPFIGPRGLEQLHKYKYRGEDHSLLSKYILQPFWSRFVLLFPLWLA